MTSTGPEPIPPNDWRTEAKARQAMDRRLARKRAEGAMGSAGPILIIGGLFTLVLHLIFFSSPLDVLGEKLPRPNVETLEQMSVEDREAYEGMRSGMIEKVRLIHGSWAGCGLLLVIAALLIHRFPLTVSLSAFGIVVAVLLIYLRSSNLAHSATFVWLTALIPLLGKVIHDAWRFHEKEKEFSEWRASLPPQ